MLPLSRRLFVLAARQSTLHRLYSPPFVHAIRHYAAQQSTASDASTVSTRKPEISEKVAAKDDLSVTDKQKSPFITRAWAKVKEEASHYWHGTKLLGKEIKISSRLQWRLLKGYKLTRRERRQLKRTTQDLLRLIPFIPFVIIPFMEFLLPVALKLFPNMLPSTFENANAANEKKRKLLKVRLEMAKFLQETVRESGIASNAIKDSEEFKEFFRKVRSTGEKPSTEDIVKVAKLFDDELTLDNLSRPQLVSMCRYMNVNAFGTDNFLRYTMRSRLTKIGQDDRLIYAEGIDSLSPTELSQACISRGIRTVTSGSSEDRMRTELEQWIDLHLRKGISGTLLILSKAFSFTDSRTGAVPENAQLESLKDTLSSLPDSLLNEAELKVSSESASHKQRLEVLQQQEELIEDEAEQEQKEEAARKAAKAAEVERDEAERREAELITDEERKLASSMLPQEQVDQAFADTSKNDVRMTTEQLSELAEALSILSAKSSVLKERQDLAKLMEENRVVEAEAEKDLAEESAISTADKSEKEKEEEKESRGNVALAKRVQKMITEIDQQLEAYDAEVGNRMQRFSCDDGRISVADLQAAFEAIKHRPDADSITALIQKLDVDGDGFVPLEHVLSLSETEGLGIVLEEGSDAESLLGKGREIRQGASTSINNESKPKEEKKPRKEDIVLDH